MASLGKLAITLPAPFLSAADSVELAVRAMTHGEYSVRFWVGGVVVGLALPAALVIWALAADVTSPGLTAVAGLAALVGIAVGHGSGTSALPMMAAIALVALGATLSYWLMVRPAAPEPAEAD